MREGDFRIRGKEIVLLIFVYPLKFIAMYRHAYAQRDGQQLDAIERFRA